MLHGALYRHEPEVALQGSQKSSGPFSSGLTKSDHEKSYKAGGAALVSMIGYEIEGKAMG